MPQAIAPIGQKEGVDDSKETVDEGGLAQEEGRVHPETSYRQDRKGRESARNRVLGIAALKIHEHAGPVIKCDVRAGLHTR